MPTLLTTSEVAEFFRLTTDAVNDMRFQGLLPYIRLLGDIRFVRSDILAYLDRNRVVPCR